MENNNECKNQRTYTIDLLKIVCEFLIIYVHFPFQNKLGEYILALTRIAVPIFFMISGFFWEKTKKNKKKRIKRLFKLVILTNILYLIWNIIKNDSEIINMFNKKNLFNFIFFNDSPFSFNLWYLNAILYTEIFISIIDKLKLSKQMKYAIPILLVISLAFGKYSMIFLKRDFSIMSTRNYLFTGVPYYLIGNIIYNNKYKIIKKVSILNLIILALFFTFTTCIEKFILMVYNVDSLGDQYISTIFLSITVFILTLVMNERKDFSKLKNYKISKYSTMIYIIHPIIISFSNVIFYHIRYLDKIYKYSKHFWIFVESIAFSIIYYRIKEKIIKTDITKKLICTIKKRYQNNI